MHRQFKTQSQPLPFSWQLYSGKFTHSLSLSKKLETFTHARAHACLILYNDKKKHVKYFIHIRHLCLRKCRIEKVRLDRKDGISKVAGTIFCVAGATVITLYKGPTIYSPKPPVVLHSITPAPYVSTLGDAAGKSWTLGCIYLIGHCLSWSGWLVLQAPVLKKYPARLSVTSYTCFFGLIQFAVIALIAERNPQAWIFHSGGELFTIVYAVSDSL